MTDPEYFGALRIAVDDGDPQALAVLQMVYRRLPAMVAAHLEIDWLAEHGLVRSSAPWDQLRHGEPASTLPPNLTGERHLA